ncbi:MAG: hypothetical protein ACU85E_14520, partial [Gammaproteobacteria bacterium]
MKHSTTLPPNSMLALEPFRSALALLDSQLEQLLAALTEGDRESIAESAEQISEGWQLLAEQLVETGTPALMDLIAIYAENLDLLLANRQSGLSVQDQALLQRWHRACGDYLQAPADLVGVARWVSLLTETLWPEPLSDEDAGELIDALTEFAEAMTEAQDLKPVAAQTEAETAQPLADIVAKPICALTDDDPIIEPLAERPVKPVDRALVQMIAEEFGKVADDLTHTLAKFNCASLAEYQLSLSANDFLL